MKHIKLFENFNEDEILSKVSSILSKEVNNKKQMKHLKVYEEYNRDLIYHFTSLYGAIGIINLDRLYSTQNHWGSKSKKYNSQISFTRDKNLYKDPPNGVSVEVRFVFDLDRLRKDFRLSPVKFSKLWDESEEALFTIGSWSDRANLKKHQIFDIKKYVISIDILLDTVYHQIETYEYDTFEKIIKDITGEDVDLIDDYLNGQKINRKLINVCKQWFESKGFNCRLVGKFNKKQYISDRKLL